jgi:hypothetical protein
VSTLWVQDHGRFQRPTTKALYAQGRNMRILAALLMLFPLFVYAETTAYLCSYTTYSDSEGNHKVDKKFELNFIVDNESGKSYLLGNNGSSEVEALKSGDQISFLEVTGGGNLMTTAIDGKLGTVHSRNTIIFGEIVASQYYGKCVVK